MTYSGAWFIRGVDVLKSLPLSMLVLAAIDLSLVGCGAKKRAEGQSATAITKPPLAQPTAIKRRRLLGLFGGYMSCSRDQQTLIQGTRMVRYMNLIGAKLKLTDTTPPEYVISCFTLDASNVNFVTSHDPEVVKQHTVEDFVAEFVAMINPADKQDVHIVGHSYGGWLGLKIAATIEDADPPRSIVTIDPISHELCTPPDVVDSLLGAPPKPACQQGPADLPQDVLSSIGERSKTWLNFYQTDAHILHSGSLTGAQNIKRSYEEDPLAPHTQIADDSKVIDQVVEAVRL